MTWLTDIFNKKRLIKVLSFVMLFFVFSAHSSFAFTKNYSDYCGFLANSREKTAERNKFDTDETKKKVKQVNNVEDKIESFCKKFESYLKNLKKEGREFGGTKDFEDEIYRKQGFFKTKEVEDFDAYSAHFDALIAKSPTLKKEYDGLQEEYKSASEELQSARDEQEEVHKKAIAAGEYQPCGPEFPRGCPAGTQCYRERFKMVGSNRDAMTTTYEARISYSCLDPDSKAAKKEKYTRVVQGEDTDEVREIVSTGGIAVRTTITEDGVKTSENLHKIESKCDIQKMQANYQSSCYSCIIVKTLIETFMSACAVAYDVASEAGVKLLALGALIWMAFFVLKNVSSLANVEPGAMVNTIAVFLFKVMVAYILITSGLGVLVKYTVNPFLTAGADFGNALMATTGEISGAVDPKYAIKMATVKAEGGKGTTEIISADVINKIMLFSENIDKQVSTNLVVGHAITCHSLNAGAWDLKIIQIVNVWLWACGAAIWFVGFMLTLGICFYLLDISFKLGFAIMVMPIAIGLWPFNITKGKITAIISIVLKSGATFAFLGLTTTYTLILISSALRDIPTLLAKISAGETTWISDTFDITGPYFLIIVFAYLYSMKLIASTVSDYVDKFFSDGVFGNASPMHQMTTQAVDFAKQKALKTLGAGGKFAKDAIKKEANQQLGNASKFVKGLFKGKTNDEENDDSSGGVGGAVKGGGQAVKASGKAVKNSGAAVEQTGKGVEAAGKGVEAAGKGAEVAGKGAAAGGKGIMSGGKGMMSAGATMSATGVGAIVGVPMMIAGAAVTAGGAAVTAGGKATEVAGKVTQKAGKIAQNAGKAMKKGGKAMKKVGDKMEKAGDKIEKAGEKIQRVGEKIQFGDGGNEDKEQKQEPAPQPQPDTENPPSDKK